MGWFGFGSLAGTRRKRKSAQDLYRTFHGVEPRGRMVEVPVPRGPLMLIGSLMEMVYRPPQRSKLHDSEFVHASGDFGDHKNMKMKSKPLLATDGYNFFIIKQGRAPWFDPERGIMG